MAKSVELRRQADADGDVLTPEGVRTAVEIGRRLEGAYDFLISSGAQRATQTLACFLTGMGRPVAGGVVVNTGFRSSVEERWLEATAEPTTRTSRPFAGLTLTSWRRNPPSSAQH